MRDVFWLSSTLAFDAKLEYTSFMRLETELCPLDPRHASKSRCSKPLKVIGSVRSMTDFEWTVFNDILVNQAVIEGFQKAGFTGAAFIPAELFTTTETPIGREVFELKAIGWGGVAPEESGVRVIEECPFCKRQVFSIYREKAKLFNRRNWDGSDFFIIWPIPRWIMVSRRVRDHIVASGYSGVRARDLEDLPVGVVKTISPGQLNDWFDEASPL
jgi:hypothetical protein